MFKFITIKHVGDATHKIFPYQNVLNVAYEDLWIQHVGDENS